MHMYNFLCSYYTSFFFFLLYMVFIHVIVHGTEYTTFDLFSGLMGSFGFTRCCFKVEHGRKVLRIFARANIRIIASDTSLT